MGELEDEVGTPPAGEPEGDLGAPAPSEGVDGVSGGFASLGGFSGEGAVSEPGSLSGSGSLSGFGSVSSPGGAAAAGSSPGPLSEPTAPRALSRFHGSTDHAGHPSPRADGDAGLAPRVGHVSDIEAYFAAAMQEGPPVRGAWDLVPDVVAPSERDAGVGASPEVVPSPGVAPSPGAAPSSEIVLLSGIGASSEIAIPATPESDVTLSPYSAYSTYSAYASTAVYEPPLPYWHPELIVALEQLSAELARVRLPLDVPGAEAARRTHEELSSVLTTSILPRLREPGRPLLVAVGGGTGVGKSTLLNSLLGDVVSPGGVVRPTTRRPILVCAPGDVGAFGGVVEAGVGADADTGFIAGQTEPTAHGQAPHTSPAAARQTQAYGGQDPAQSGQGQADWQVGSVDRQRQTAARPEASSASASASAPLTSPSADWQGQPTGRPATPAASMSGQTPFTSALNWEPQASGPGVAGLASAAGYSSAASADTWRGTASADDVASLYSASGDAILPSGGDWTRGANPADHGASPYSAGGNAVPPSGADWSQAGSTASGAHRGHGASGASSPRPDAGGAYAGSAAAAAGPSAGSAWSAADSARSGAGSGAGSGGSAAGAAASSASGSAAASASDSFSVPPAPRPHPALPPGLALLDTPDIDSVVAGNRAVGGRLLACADVVVLVTSAERYADAPPWRVLKRAGERGTPLAVVLDRVPAEVAPVVRDACEALLEVNGLGGTPLFLVETQRMEGGLLPAGAVSDLGRWLQRLAEDRARVGARAVHGRLETFGRQVAAVAEAAAGQWTTVDSLQQTIERVYTAERVRFRGGLETGELFGGEVLVRWQEVLGGDRVAALLDGDDEAPELREALIEAIAQGNRAAMERAARKTREEWHGIPGAPDLAIAARYPDAATPAASWLERLPGVVRDLVRTRRVIRGGDGARGAGLLLGIAAIAGRIDDKRPPSALALHEHVRAVFGEEGAEQLLTMARTGLRDACATLLERSADAHRVQLAAYQVKPHTADALRTAEENVRVAR